MSQTSTHNGFQSAGFVFVPAEDMQKLFEHTGSLADWNAFSASWNNLAVDTFMADKGRYRKRRYAVYEADAKGTITRQPHQPHYQTVDYNRVNGGIDRLFEPILPEIGAGASLNTILRFCHHLFNGFKPAPSWHIETHQFRIEAQANQQGLPTPEGMHRDGVDYVLVLMIRRQNIASGVTTIHDSNHYQIGQFILTDAFDAALVDDRKVYHGVTAVKPIDPQLPAYRDVFVVTFRATKPA